MAQGVVAAPGAFNALVARAVANAGFHACYVSGGATSVAAGVPDVGLLTLDHFSRIVREVVTGSGLPTIADADTGFGEEEMVRRTVIEYNHAGAAGLHLEDQVFPKRCGHLDGKALIPVDQAVSKIEWAARASRDCSNGDFIICARTDAKGVEGFDAAIDRAEAYVNAGAAMIFPEGLSSEEEFEAFAKTLRERLGATRVRLLANMTEFGKSELFSTEQLRSAGINIVIWPVSLLRVAMGSAGRALDELDAKGHLRDRLDEMQHRADLYDLIDYEQYNHFDSSIFNFTVSAPITKE